MTTPILRHAVRALIVDPADGAVLLAENRFPGWSRSRWMTPGGGIDPGEAPLDALVREIREETGLRLGPGVPITGPVWTRRARFHWQEADYDQRERFYLVEHGRFAASPGGNPAVHEVEALLGFDWWTPARMAASDAQFFPRALAEHLAELLVRGPPPTPVEVGA